LASCWKTSTYLLRTFFFAACDLGRPIGGGANPDDMLAPGIGVVGTDTASGGTRFDLVRMGGFEEAGVLRSIADAVRASCGANGGPEVPPGPPSLLA